MSSIWSEFSDLPSFPKLSEDIRVNTCIVGGGIAGILCAYYLKKGGVDCCLIERDTICSGTTKNTTAKITLLHSLIYDKIIKAYGLEAGQEYYNANNFAISEYAGLCKKIGCDFEFMPSYVYSQNDRKKLENEVTALNKLGCSAKLVDTPLLPIKTAGAVCCENQAQFNPLKFISGIAKGLPIYEHTFALEFAKNSLTTNNGKISFENCVIATHFPIINKHGMYFMKMYQHRSYELVLKGAPLVDGMYVDENKKGFSFRNYGDYLLLGGGGHRTGKKGGGFSALRDFADEKYPQAVQKAQWAAQDCISLDGIPYIGNYSANTPNLYVASGFNKWGITSSMVSANIISRLIIDKKCENSRVFSPDRSILKPQLFINGFEAASNLLSITKKRCPHMKCALKWNKSERTWDCCCHGSRFDESGKLLDNPANGNLHL